MTDKARDTALSMRNHFDEEIVEPLKEKYEVRVAQPTRDGFKSVEETYERYVYPEANTIGARGEDPEIDFKVTHDALLFEQEATMAGAARRMSDAVADFAGNVAEAFADGARKINLTERYSEK